MGGIVRVVLCNGEADDSELGLARVQRGGVISIALFFSELASSYVPQLRVTLERRSMNGSNALGCDGAGAAGLGPTQGTVVIDVVTKGDTLDSYIDKSCAFGKVSRIRVNVFVRTVGVGLGGCLRRVDVGFR